jgi:enoyl-CoA hydratase
LIGGVNRSNHFHGINELVSMVWKVEDLGGVCLVTMKSNKTNCINYKFIQDGNETLDLLTSKYPSTPIILTSATDSIFSSGMDLMEVFKANTPEKFKSLFIAFGGFLQRLMTFPTRTIGAINGSALAGGLVLALACDYRVAVKDTNFKFGLNEVAIGLSFPVSLEMINFKIGTRNTWDVALGARMYSTNQAKQVHFVNELTTKEDFMKRCVEEARLIRPDAMLAYSTTKSALLEGVIEQTSKENERRLDECVQVKNSPGTKKIMLEIYQKMTKSKM